MSDRAATASHAERLHRLAAVPEEQPALTEEEREAAIRRIEALVARGREGVTPLRPFRGQQ